ncbi:MAG: hypothetical protein KBG19_00575 [Bacteroidales bacterium]|jgi:hypothetical protein|nr:hypothetical protein [Bacteroidales bacterium]
MTLLDRLDRLHPDLISSFLTTGKSEAIPMEVQLFLKQLQWAAEIYEFERNVKRAANQLRVRILAEQKLSLDVRTCMARIYAAINYFHIDNNVSIKVWESNFADRYENIAKMCLAKGDYKTMKACEDAALECRRRASEIAETDKDWAPIFLISPNITVEDVGFKKKKLKDIARKSNEGYYINLIDSLPIDNDEKKRLLEDANIYDVDPIIEDSTDE